MSFNVERTSGGGDFTVEPGVYLGTLVTIVDMGVQSRGTYKGEKLADAPLLGLEFEVVREDDSRVKLFKEVLKSGHEQSNLFAISLALLGGGSKAEEELSKTIPVEKLLGKSATITVGLTSGKKPKITTLTALMKGQVVPVPKSELVSFSVSSPDEESLAKLPKFLREKLSKPINKEDDESDF